ncbi:type II toxin-antitoxin system MqsA family antitoxin [Azospirillum sp. YIM B02556]|uniref:Type II toxin-antitoxin system MqsA family antitoxin n=1 Tax=Azospirillum endophyticum TaxID=2800326 RepID=A0ABS1FA48_9PROT|nr:type II toxin-antitoxin system MqsA family antitoxin [Azospirillum endophyticum]MBK1840308.1 type II toxin-antitoxin system MqsA family antitoxin [Azospirillum endophyticum]
MGKPTLTDAERTAALAAVDWERIDAMTDEDIARQIAENPDAAPDLSDVPADALRVIHPPGGVSVRGIRAKLNLTQRAFADRFGFNLATLRDWEQGRYQPDIATQTLLFVIEREPELVANVVAERNAA